MLVAFGAIKIDMVFPVASLPRVGHLMQSEPGWHEVGGHAANQAVAAARDGCRTVLVGALGTDALGDEALAALKETGVHLRGITRHPGATGRSAVLLTPDGHTVAVTDIGAGQHARADQVADRLLGPGRTLLLQMDVDPGENARLIARARRLGTRVVLNLSPVAAIDTDALRSVDLLVGTSAELAWLGEHVGTGNNPASLRAALGMTVVRMLGVQGAEGAWEGGYLHMPALPVQMHDTTAATDGFVGVLAAALDKGAALPDALRRATVAAALSVTKRGAACAMPQGLEIDAAMAHAPAVTARQPEVAG